MVKYPMTTMLPGVIFWIICNLLLLNKWSERLLIPLGYNKKAPSQALFSNECFSKLVLVEVYTFKVHHDKTL